jgi:hypothetical protein
MIAVTDSPPAYIAVCPYCEQGFLRIAVCRNCQQAVAICEECEAVWKEPRALKSSTSIMADAQHPHCPHCGQSVTTWEFPKAEGIELLGLSDLISGYSR